MKTKKINSLLNYLKNKGYELNFNDLHIINDYTLEVNGCKYYILTPLERDEVFYKEVSLKWNRVGLSECSSSLVDRILDECLDTKKLEYLGENELVEYDEETRSYFPLGTSWGYDNPIKYLYHDVDENEVTKIINKYELLDMNKLCKLILSCEGYSTTLATFDHEEIPLGEYYGYFIGF